MNLHELVFKSYSHKIRQWRPFSLELKVCYLVWKLYLKNYGIYKENIDQINTTGHVLNVYLYSLRKGLISSNSNFNAGSSI